MPFVRRFVRFGFAVAVLACLLGCQQKGGEGTAVLVTAGQRPGLGGDAELLSGGQPLAWRLVVIRRWLLGAIAAKLREASPECSVAPSSELDQDPTYLFLKFITPGTKTACDTFLGFALTQMRERLRGFPGTRFLVSETPVLVNGVRKAAHTDASKEGDIAFDPDLSGVLSFRELVQLGGHELGHKVENVLFARDGYPIACALDSTELQGTRMENVLNYAGATLALFNPPAAFADDPSFGENGRATLAVPGFGPSPAPLKVISLEPRSDGFLYAFGNASRPSGETGIFVALLNDSGAQDPTLGENGFLRLLPDETRPELGAVVADGAGGYWLSGSLLDGSPVLKKLFVLKLRADLTTDTTFGTAGLVTVGVPTRHVVPSRMVLDSTRQRILVGADLCVPTICDRLAVIAVPIGSDAAAFGTDGILQYSFTNFPGMHLRALLVQEDGKVLIGGFANTLAGRGAGIVLRRLADGSPDTTFAAEGIYRTPFISYNSQTVETLALTANGGIRLGGRVGSNGRYYNFVAALTTNGTRDAAFGTSGRIFFLTRGTGALLHQRVADMRVTESGRIVGLSRSIAAMTLATEGGNSTAFALTAAGAFDTSQLADGYRYLSTGTCRLTRMYRNPLPYYSGDGCVVRTW